MTNTRRGYERTLRTVMWMDAFLSVAMVAGAVLAVPVVAAVGLPRSIVFSVGMASLVCGVLLALFGAITAVVLALRMSSGRYLLPAQLRLPLPPGMRPALTTEPAHGFGVALQGEKNSGDD